MLNNLASGIRHTAAHRRSWGLRAAVSMFLLALSAQAGPPPELPGDDITTEYSRLSIPEDSIVQVAPPASPQSGNWLETAEKTWDAPSLERQMARDAPTIPLGKGGVFIPALAKANLEPDIDFLDSAGNARKTAKPGRSIFLLPGRYYAMMGSGSHQQRLVRAVDIVESKIVPLVPDWAGLSVEVVDESNIPFRGQYEIARIDEFEAYGRGSGADPTIGEELKTWVLKPGLYKVFMVGETYNTQKNYVTVRLLPGEFVRFVLIENNATEMKIMGGGVSVSRVDREIASNWKYGFDIGGTILFNARTDHRNTRVDTIDYASSATILQTSWLSFRKEPMEWNTQLKLDEGINITKLDLSRLESSTDKMRFTSLFTWRILPWLGPYSRIETNNNLFPVYAHTPPPDSTYKHYMVILNKDSTLTGIDSINTLFRLQPSFSPFTFEAGTGANMNLVASRFFEARLLAGIGFKSETRGSQAGLCDSVRWSGDSFLDTAYAHVRNKPRITVRRFETTTARPEYGPEAAINALLRLGTFGTAETEFKILLPIERMQEPDVEWTNTLSWRIVRGVTLDYEFTYSLKQPPEADARKNETNHRIIARFSYTSR